MRIADNALPEGTQINALELLNQGGGLIFRVRSSARLFVSHIKYVIYCYFLIQLKFVIVLFLCHSLIVIMLFLPANVKV